MKRWGLTPQKPAKRAYERSPKAVKKWLKSGWMRLTPISNGVPAKEMHWM